MSSYLNAVGLLYYTELNTTYTLKKTGPKYTDIEFHIVKKEAKGPKKEIQTQLELGMGYVN